MPGRRGLGLTLMLLTAALVFAQAFAQQPQSSPPPPPRLDGVPPQRAEATNQPPPLEDSGRGVGARVDSGRGVLQQSSAHVVVETLAPQAINLGRPLLTELVLRNIGGAPAHQVRVEAELPPKVESVASEPKAELRGNQLRFEPLDAIRPGEEKRLRIQFKTTSEGDMTTRATVTFSSQVAQTTKITRPQLVIKKKGPATAAVGESITFRVELANVGTGPAEGIVIRDQLPEGLQHPAGEFIEADVGTLQPGQAKAIELTVKAVAKGKLVNEVTATGEDDLNVTDSTAVVVGQPMLKLTKRGPAQVFVNAEAVFELNLANPGDAPARNVELIDALPAGVRFAGASDSGRYDQASHSVQWRFDALQPNEARQVLVKVAAAKAGEWKNQAAVRAEPGLADSAQALLNIVGVPAILLEVVDLDDPLEVNGETSYEIRVLNQGTAAHANVQVLVVVPDGMTPTRAQADLPHRIQGQQVIFEPLPKLAPKADLVYRVFVRGDAPGDHRVKVQLSSDQLRIPVAEEESTRVYRD